MKGTGPNDPTTHPPIAQTHAHTQPPLAPHQTPNDEITFKGGNDEWKTTREQQKPQQRSIETGPCATTINAGQHKQSRLHTTRRDRADHDDPQPMVTKGVNNIPQHQHPRSLKIELRPNPND